MGTMIFYMAIIKQYRKIMPGEFFVVGVDTAAGGIDNCVAQFLSKPNIDIPIIYSENVTATEATPKIKAMLEKIYDITKVRPVVAFERNNGGVFEMERLLRMNKADKYRGYEMIEYGTNKGRIPFKIGWETNGATRPKMLSDLKEAIDNKLIRIYDRETVDELYGFIVIQLKTRWKASADFGKHDDKIMSAAIAWQLYQTESAIDDLDYTDLPSQKLFDKEGYY